MLPFVSVICPTMPGRAEWLPKAIDCFLSQDYEGIAELIIIADSDPEAVLFHWEPCDPMREGFKVTIIACAGPHKASIGAKRNAGCAAARGEIIVHLDDDDWSAPGRLTDQVKRLQESGKAVTGYRILKYTDGESWWKCELPVSRVYGTTLCYRRDWWQQHPFQPFNDAVDNAFCHVAALANQLIGADANDLMYATNHAGNSSPRVPPPASWKTEPICISR
jgi:O-antigen biosynthesis protein